MTVVHVAEFTASGMGLSAAMAGLSQVWRGGSGSTNNAMALTEEPVVNLGPLAPMEPAPEVVDNFWMDVVGIPFDLWCSLGKCHGPRGFELGDMVGYLTGRRDAGDFRAPVDLVKRSRRVRDLPPALEPSSRSVDWVDTHSQHGIVWNRYTEGGHDLMTATCLDCGQVWTHNFRTGKDTVKQVGPIKKAAGPRGIQGLYRDLDVDEMRAAWKRQSPAAKRALMISSETEYSECGCYSCLGYVPPNPGLRRQA